LLSSRKSVVNFNDRGARLDGANLVHPHDSETLEKTIQEHLKTFPDEEIKLHAEYKPLSKVYKQLREVLKGEEIFLAKIQKFSEKGKLDALKEWATKTDHAQLIGSHAYNLMSFLVQNRQDSKFLTQWISEYKSILGSLIGVSH